MLLCRCLLCCLVFAISTNPAHAGWNPFGSDWLESAPTPHNSYRLEFLDEAIEEKIITLIEVTADQRIIYSEEEGGGAQSVSCHELKQVVELNGAKTTGRTVLAAAFSFLLAGITGGASAVVNGVALLGGGLGYVTRDRSGEEFCELAQVDVDEVISHNLIHYPSEQSPT